MAVLQGSRTRGGPRKRLSDQVKFSCIPSSLEMSQKEANCNDLNQWGVFVVGAVGGITVIFPIESNFNTKQCKNVQSILCTFHDAVRTCNSLRPQQNMTFVKAIFFFHPQTEKFSSGSSHDNRSGYCEGVVFTAEPLNTFKPAGFGAHMSEKFAKIGISWTDFLFFLHMTYQQHSKASHIISSRNSNQKKKFDK